MPFLHQQFGHLGACCMLHPDHDDPRRMLPDRVDLGSPVANVLVPGHRNPTLSPDQFNPLPVRRIGGKVVVVYLNPDPFAPKPGRNRVLPQIPVEKENRSFRPRPGARTGPLPRFPHGCARNPAPNR